MRAPRIRLASALVGAVAVIVAPWAQAAPANLSLDLTSAFTMDCFAPQYVLVVEGDCDGLSSYTSILSDQFPTGTLTARGISWKLGSLDLRDNNTAVADGKVVSAPGTSGYRWAHILLTGVNGPTPNADVALSYKDGTKAKAKIKTKDWTVAAEAVAEVKTQNLFTAATGGINHVYVQSVALDPSKGLTSISVSGNDKYRIFAITLSTEALKAAGPRFR